MKTKQTSKSGTQFIKLPFSISHALASAIMTFVLLWLPASAWAANGTAYYFDVNGTTAGFGSPSGSTNNNSSVWSTSSAGTTAPGAYVTGAQLTFGASPSDFNGNTWTVAFPGATTWAGLLVNSTNANITFNGTANAALSAANTWTVPAGSTFNEDITFNPGTGAGLNCNNSAVTLYGGGTINFQSTFGYNDTSPFTENMTNGTVNLYTAYTGGTTAEAGYILIAGALNFTTTASANSLNGLQAGKLFSILGGTIDNTSGSPLVLSLGAGTYSISNFTFNGSSSLDFGPANVNEGTNTSVITVNNNTLTISGAITNLLGGIAKAGPGTLTLAGVSTYTNGTLVSAGTLIVGGSGSVNSTITVNGSGAKLVQLSGTPDPVNLTLGTLDGTGKLGNVTVANNTNNVLTAGNGGTGALTISNLTFSGAATINGVNNAVINVSNVLTANTNIITLNASSYGGWGFNSTAPLTNILLTYGSLAGGGTNNFVLGNVSGLSPRQSASMILLPGTVGLQIVGGDIPVWTGAQNNKWTTNAVGGLQNWKMQSAGTNTEFLNGDYVVFDDTLVGSTNVVISDANVLPNNATFSNNSEGYLLSGSFGIGGGGSLTMNGTAKVTITTSNSYSGGTTINSGTVQFGDGTAINGYVQGNISDNGVLIFANPSAQSLSGIISSNGSVTKIGGGVLTLSGASTYTGGTTISAGTVSIANANALSSGTIDFTGNSALQWNGINKDLSSQLIIEDGVTATLDTMTNIVSLKNSALQFGGSQTGGLTKVGAGTLVIGSVPFNNSYSGNTTIKSGTLVAGANSGFTGIGNNTTVYIGDTSASSNATLQLGTNTTTTYNNNINVQSGNTGLMALIGSGNITLNGTVTLGLPSGTGKGLTIADTGPANNLLNLNGVIQDPSGLTLGTAGVVMVGVAANQGQVRLSATNTYTGNTRAAFSVLGLNNTAALQNSTLDMNAADSGAVSFINTGNYTLGGLQGSRSLALGASSLTVGNNNQSTLYSGALSGGGGITKIGSGIVALAGTNTYTGNTTISAGTLALTNNGAISGSTNINVAGGAILDVSGQSSTYKLGTFQTLSGSGTVTGSVATLSGATIYAGTLGTAGTLAFSNNVSFTNGGNAGLALTTNAASGNSQFTVAGNLSLNSTNTIFITEIGTGNLDTNTPYVLFAVAGTTTMASTPVLVFTSPQPTNAAHYSLALTGNNVVMQYNAVAGPTVVASVSPNPALRNQPVTISAVVTMGDNSISGVTVDLSSLGGSSTQAMTTSDNTNYSYTIAIPGSQAPAAVNIGRVTVTDTATPTPLKGYYYPPTLVINSSTEIWDGNAVNQNFSSNTNWVSDFAPGLVGDSLDFGGATGLTPNMDLSYTVNGVVFDSSASSFTIGSSSSTLTLSGFGTGVTNNSGVVQMLNVPVVMSTPQTFDAASGGIVLGGMVSGTNSLTTIGANYTLWLNASNTYTGGTFITNGTLSISNAYALGSTGTIDFTGNSTLQWNNGVSTDLSSRLQINDGVNATLDTTTNNVTLASALTWGSLKTGTLTKAGSGVLTLSGINSYSGSATVAGGTLSLTGPTTLVGQNLTVGSLSSVSAVAKISTNATINSLFIGTTAGTAGATYITGGTVTNTASASGINFAVDGYGYLNISGGTLAGPPFWQGGYLNGSHPNGVGIITQTGGTFNQTGSTPSPFVMGGLNNDGGIGVYNQTGGSLNVIGGVSGSSGAYIASGWDTSSAYGRGEFNFSGGTATAAGFYFKGGVTGVLNLLGGTLAVNTVATLTTFNNTNAIGYVNFNGGTLQALTNGALINLIAAGVTNNLIIYSGGATINTGTNNVSIVNPIKAPSASGVSGIALINGGTGYIGEPYVQLTGGDGFGATARAQINLAIGTVTNIIITSPGTGYTVAPTAALLGGGATVNATLGTVALASNIGGGLTKTGTGTLTLLSAANTYVGATTISNGTLQVDGSLAAGSAVTVVGGTLSGVGTINGATAVNAGAYLAAGDGGIGLLTFNNNLTLNAASTNRFVVTTAGGASNRVLVTAGTLTPNASRIEINTAGAANLGAGTNVLFNYSGSTLANAFNLTPVFDTAQTGLATNAYVYDTGSAIELVVTNPASLISTDASLSNLVVNASVSPTFVPGTTNYYATNVNANPTVTVLVTNNSAFATNVLYVNGVSLATNAYTLSNTVPVNVGDNQILVVVTAQDGLTTSNYFVTVTRLPSADASLSFLALSPAGTLSPTFSSGMTNYTATNANANTSVSVTATNTSSYATNVLFYNGTPEATNVGWLTASVPLTVGAGNVIQVVVTAQDGLTTSTNTVTVTRLASANALLSNLVITPAGTLSPTFASGTTNYNATNTYANKSVTVTATSADGTAVLALSFNNGSSYSIPLTTMVASGSQTLGLPTNTVAVRAVSQDLSQTNVYTVNVLLQPSLTVPHLTNSVSGSTLALSWPADHLGYRLLVQTNNLNKGVSGNTNDWGTVAGTTTLLSTNIAIIKTGVTNEYYKLVYP